MAAKVTKGQICGGPISKFDYNMIFLLRILYQIWYFYLYMLANPPHYTSNQCQRNFQTQRNFLIQMDHGANIAIPYIFVHMIASYHIIIIIIENLPELI